MLRVCQIFKLRSHAEKRWLPAPCLPLPCTLEAEVNPLMVMPEGQGVLAVDALVLQAR